jgi:3-keto-5-aminohexanoate cleavage enzyme
MKPAILTCAITGAETTRAQTSFLPLTPEEQADDAFQVIQAGASVIHLHVRDELGKPTQSVDRFRESIDAIRKKSPQALIQISTGGAVGTPIQERLAPLTLRPEMASLNMGSTNFGRDVFINHPNDIDALREEMNRLNIVPELEVYEVGHLESCLKLLDAGLMDESACHVQFVLGVPGAMSGTEKNLEFLVKLYTDRVQQGTWGVAGIGRSQLEIAKLALAWGGHVRVGLEDNIYLSKGVKGRNVDFVNRVVELANEVKRPIATPQEARQILLCNK